MSLSRARRCRIPPCLPQDWDSLYAATLKSIRNPIGMQPLTRAGPQGKHRGLRHPGHRQGRQPAHQPPQGGHPRLPGRAVQRRRGEEGYPAALLQRPAPARHGAGDEDHPGRRAVQRVLLHRSDHQPRQRGLRAPGGPGLHRAGATTVHHEQVRL